MLRGCLLSLVLLGALIGGYYYWFDQVFEPPGSWIGAGVAGFLAFCCVGAISNAIRAWGDWSLVATARRDVVLVDGCVSAVCGPIHPLGEPLAAPFSGTPCVLCEYDLTSAARVAKADAADNKTSGSDYAGFLMAPSAIRTPLGDVRVLGFPITDGFAERRCSSPLAIRNARKFLTTHQFEDRTGMKFVKVLSVFGEIWSDEDGLVEKNMQFGKVTIDELFPPSIDEEANRLEQWRKDNPDSAPHEADDADDEDEGDDVLDGSRPSVSIPRMVEKLVPLDEPVCVIGIYDEVRRGLVPPPGSSKPNRLLRGTADEIEARLRGSIVRQALGGIIGLVLIQAAIVGVMALYRNSPDVVRDQQSKATQAVHKGDVAALEPLVRRGLDVNFRDADGRTLLMFVPDAATADWLLANGAQVNVTDRVDETPLIQAARYGRTDVVRQLLAAQANLNPRSRATRLTPLGEAQTHGHEETAGVLRAAGAQE